MTLRGYQGEFYYTAKEPCKAKDWLYMGVVACTFCRTESNGMKRCVGRHLFATSWKK